MQRLQHCTLIELFINLTNFSLQFWHIEDKKYNVPKALLKSFILSTQQANYIGFMHNLLT